MYQYSCIDVPRYQPLMHTLLSLFTEVLPLVEFFLEQDITDEEAVHLLDSEAPRKKEKDEWKETAMGSILYKQCQRLY